MIKAFFFSLMFFISGHAIAACVYAHISNNANAVYSSTQASGSCTALNASFAIPGNTLSNTQYNSLVTLLGESGSAFTQAQFDVFLAASTNYIALNSRVDALEISSANSEVFDPVLAGSFWMFAITMVIGCYLLGKFSGIILDFVRRG